MERTWREKIEGTTDQILAQIKRLMDEGNIRRGRREAAGKVIADFPLTVGVVGTVLAPRRGGDRRTHGRARGVLNRGREDQPARAGTAEEPAAETSEPGNGPAGGRAS